MERHQPPEAASVGPTASTPDPVNALSSLVARGSIALLARQAVAFSCLFLSGIGLARTLGPSDLGLLTIALLVTRIGAVLVDGGLGAALVRQSSPPSAGELHGTFTAQLLVALATSSLFALLGLVAWLESPNWFAPSAYFACTISVLAMAGVSVPLAVLERDMKFGRLGLVTLVQPLTFATGVAMVVVLDAGLIAVSLAVAASHWLQVPVAALLSGHAPRVARIDPGIRGRFKFGAPLMGSALISTAKDAVNPLFIPLALGVAAVGLITWAQQLAVLATYAVAALARVIFPAFSRLAGQPEALRDAMHSAAHWFSALVAPIACFLYLNAQTFTQVIYGPEWFPALDTMRLLLVANLLAPLAAVLMAGLNAQGRTLITLGYTAVWAIATWLTVPLLASTFGIEGYGIANILVTLTTLGLVWQARSLLPLSLALRSLVAWPIAAIATTAGYLAATYSGAGATGALLIAALLSVVLYFPCLTLASPHQSRRLRKALTNR